MADNLLSLMVKFTAMDGLSGSLKSMIGLGRSSKDEMRGLASELVNVKKGIRAYDDQLKTATGSVNSLWSAQKKLMQQEEELRAKIERRRRLEAIDGRTASIQRQANTYKSEGRAGLMSAALLMAPGMAIAHEAGEYQAMQNKLRILGLNDGAVNELTAYSKAMGVAGSSAKENLRYLLEAQGAFRESGEHSAEEQLKGAKMMAPIMAKMAATLKASGKELGEEQERYFLRFVEQAGGTTDPKRAAALTDGLFRAIQSSGGTVDASTYQSFLARAGTSGMKLSARTMFADFEPLIAELHDSAGVGLQGAYSRMNGMVKNQASARELLRLGLWNKDAVVFNQVGGIKEFKNGANPMGKDAAATLSSDPVEFYRKYVLPAYQKRGVTDVERENMVLFGKSGGALFNLINKQLPTILRSREAYTKTQSLDQAYNTTKDSFFGQSGQMKAAAQDFMVAAGSKGGLLESMTGMLKSATGALRGLTNAANAHPTAFRFLGTAVLWLIGLRVATAGAKLAFGGLLGPVGQLWGLWSKYKELGSVAAMFPKVAKAMGLVRTAALFMGQGVMRAGAMMYANPMVLALVAIGVTVGVLAYLVYSNWDKIKATFNQGWTSIKSSVGKGIDWVKQKWEAFSGAISGFFEKHWTRIRNLFLTALVIFFPFVAALVWVGAKIYNNWDKISATFKKGWGWVKSTVGPGVDWLREKWGLFTAGLDWVGTKASDAWRVVSSAFSRAWNPIKSAFGDGIAWVKAQWKGFTDWIKNTALAKAMQWGADIATGLGNGIKRFGGKAIDTVGNFSDNVGGKFAEQLQIRSPSRVFMAFGGHIADGLSIGLDRHGHRPVQSMRRMATAVAGAGALALAPAAGASAASSARAPVKFEIHIHQQPGEDADALAQRVMDRIERAHRATGLATYQDDF